MEKVEIRKIIEDMIITQFLHSEMDMIHEEDVSFEELGLDSIDKVELDVMVEQKFNTVFDGGQNSTGNFLNNVVKTVAPALGVIDQLPIADTLKKLKGDDKNKYNGPGLHLGLIEEIKAAFIDFLPAGTVLY